MLCLKRWVTIGAIAALSGCASIGDDLSEPTPFLSPAAETALSYTVAIDGAPTADLESLLEEALELTRRQEGGAPSLALLRRRAEQDEATALRALRSQGYYAATVDAAVTPEGEAAARAVIAIDAGAPFAIAAHRLVLSGPASRGGVALDDLAAPAGAPARAADILAAEAAAVAALRSQGYIWAEAAGRRATADLAAQTLTVETALVSGPQARFGPLAIDGAEGVDPAFLRSYARWSEGDVVDPARVADYQRALAAMDLFNAASVSLPSAPPPDRETGADGSTAPVIAPVTARLEERPARSAAFGARVDTNGGPEARVSLEHRNLFGAGERGEIALLGGAEEQRADLSVRKPQFLRPGQDLTAAAALRRLEDEAYDEQAATLQAGLERRVSDRWRVGAGALAEIAQIDDDAERSTATLLGAPIFARFDGSDDLLDPTEGGRAALTATPLLILDGGQDAEALALDGQASIYQALDRERRHIVALRGRLGAILSERLSDIPANRRLYAGGGGSVRGFADRFIGPRDAGGDPSGGRLATEIGAELRSRIWGPFGGVAFVEAGGVSRELELDLEGGLLTAAGVGLRYYSPIGPIRADIAGPLAPRDIDDRFQVYFSIGQAF